MLSKNLISRRYVILLVIAVFTMLEVFYHLAKYEKERKLLEEVANKMVVEKLPSDLITDFIPPFIPIINDYVVAIGYNLLGCNIRKSMSQLTYNIVCYLNDTNAFLEKNQSMTDTWKIERWSCPTINWWFYNPLFESGELKMSQLTKFAFVRHPEERFASFYLDKCLRDGACGSCTNVRCASKMVYESLLTIASNRTTLRKDDPDMWLEWHMAPQTWNCDFYENLSDFHIIPIGTSLEDRQNAMEKLKKILNSVKVPRIHIEKIVADTVNGDTEHSTHKNLEREKVLKQIRKDPYVRTYLHHTYYYDYVAFGFDMSGMIGYQAPEVIKQGLENS